MTSRFGSSGSMRFRLHHNNGNLKQPLQWLLSSRPAHPPQLRDPWVSLWPLGEIDMAASQTPSFWIPSFMPHLSCSGLSEHATLISSSAFYKDAPTWHTNAGEWEGAGCLQGQALTGDGQEGGAERVKPFSSFPSWLESKRTISAY